MVLWQRMKSRSQARHVFLKRRNADVKFAEQLPRAESRTRYVSIGWRSCPHRSTGPHRAVISRTSRALGRLPTRLWHSRKPNEGSWKPLLSLPRLQDRSDLDTKRKTVAGAAGRARLLSLLERASSVQSMLPA